jgi:hypothetical protein
VQHNTTHLLFPTTFHHMIYTSTLYFHHGGAYLSSLELLVPPSLPVSSPYGGPNCYLLSIFPLHLSLYSISSPIIFSSHLLLAFEYLLLDIWLSDRTWCIRNIEEPFLVELCLFYIHVLLSYYFNCLYSHKSDGSLTYLDSSSFISSS